MSERAAWQALVDATAMRYKACGEFTWRMVRGKLLGDPIFRHILAEGLIIPGSRAVDLGCGRGLLAALMLAADDMHRHGRWPSSWRAAPVAVQVHGIDRNAADIHCARLALGDAAHLMQADVRDVRLGFADVVVVLDLLHYLPRSDQQRLLQNARAAMTRDGLLIVRVGDAAGGWRFRVSSWIDRIVVYAREREWIDLHTRSLSDWTQLLMDSGFRLEPPRPMSEGTPFANALLLARAA